MTNTRLADWFNKQREIIEAAELPFAKMAIFVLPVLAPLVPAVMTGLHMFKLLSELFTFTGSNIFNGVLSVVVGTVLELLGYVGALSFIRAIFDLVRHGRDEYMLPAALTGLAYLFYLLAMYLINVKLGEYFQVPSIINTITGLLSFITVPTGLLAATHLSTKENKEDEDRRRADAKDERLKKTALKNGINVFAPAPVLVQNQQVVDDVSKDNHRKASAYKEKIWRYLDEQYAQGVVPRVADVTKRFDLPYDKAKGFVSTQRTLWASSRGVLLPKKGSTE
jgi:hypothetical protein